MLFFCNDKGRRTTEFSALYVDLLTHTHAQLPFLYVEEQQLEHTLNGSVCWIKQTSACGSSRRLTREFLYVKDFTFDSVTCFDCTIDFQTTMTRSPVGKQRLTAHFTVYLMRGDYARWRMLLDCQDNRPYKKDGGRVTSSSHWTKQSQYGLGSRQYASVFAIYN